MNPTAPQHCLICGKTPCDETPLHGRTTQTTDNLTPCRFYDACGDEYDGYTDGSFWNGFANILVTEETFRKCQAAWGTASDPEDEQPPIYPSAFGPLRDLRYGYAMSLVEEEECPTCLEQVPAGVLHGGQS